MLFSNAQNYYLLILKKCTHNSQCIVHYAQVEPIVENEIINEMSEKLSLCCNITDVSV